MVRSKNPSSTVTRPNARNAAPARRPAGGRPPGRPEATGDPAPRRNVLPLVWAVLFLVGGGLIFATLPNRSKNAVPDVWNPTAVSGASELEAGLRSGGEQQGDLLRLTWPAHPDAASYRVQFAANGMGLTPVSVNGNVFLYDLASNVLGLPARFSWQVTAVMADGSEVTSPSQSYTLD